MNRHFQSYAAMPTDALGPPIRREPDPKPAPEAEWKPLRPGYEARRLPGGAVEVRCTDLQSRAAAKPVKAACHPAAEAVSPTHALPPAPTEWQSGPPPENGWREVRPNIDINSKRFAYWFGARWSFFGKEDDQSRRQDIERGPIHSVDSMQWCGPRLVGAQWPEPQA